MGSMLNQSYTYSALVVTLDFSFQDDIQIAYTVNDMNM